MININRKLAAILFLLTFSTININSKTYSVQRSIPLNTLDTVGAKINNHSLDLWIFDTKERQSEGLRFIPSSGVTDYEGAIFVFPPLTKNIRMNMKGMKFLVDILFVDANRNLIRIEHPEKDAKIDIHPTPAKYLIMLKRGMVSKMHLSLGNYVYLDKSLQFGTEKSVNTAKKERNEKEHIAKLKKTMGKSKVSILSESMEIPSMDNSGLDNYMQDYIQHNLLKESEALLTLYPDGDNIRIIRTNNLSKLYQNMVFINSKNTVIGIWQISEELSNFTLALPTNKVLYLAPGILESYQIQMGMSIDLEIMKKSILYEQA